ncbi:hypothetical protein A5733_10325 [Mycobacterium sp. NS-7484]|uniref:cytochrome P450 n=1 Tax=Mycobacterium sp. NS-7484 TaxID=1834161 RepID=UPI00096CFF3A|nr:cytochrome P450 [Mycobacterium sp. NS-7484]OMB97152.1 hypothetical protein A5733_10325 [Mycobacterium sp. NS-7484]
MPLLGNTLSMYHELPQFLAKSYFEHGPVFRVRALNNRYVVLAGPDAALFLGSAEGRASLESKPSWSKMIAEYGADKSVVSDDGDLHAWFRDIMRRGYSRHALDGRYQRLVETIDDWLDDEWRPNSVASVVKSVQNIVIRQISIAVSDRLFFDDVDQLRTLVHWSTNVCLLGRWPNFMLKLPQYRSAKARMHAIAQDLLAAFRTRSDEGQIDGFGRRLLDDLVEANRTNPDKMTDYELPLNLFVPFMAGLDTASNTIATILYILTQRTDLYDQIQPEADLLFSGGELNEEVLFETTPVLNAVVKEAMRLYPSVPALMRHARSDFSYQGHQIRAGERVMIATCVPHFMPSYFPDPYRFDPNRYLDGRKEHLQPGAYSPFGRGHHLCLGKRIAEVIIPLTVARIVNQRMFSVPDSDFALTKNFAYGVDLALNLELNIDGVRHPSLVGARR